MIVALGYQRCLSFPRMRESRFTPFSGCARMGAPAYILDSRLRWNDREITTGPSTREKKIHGAAASAAERCGICEKSSLAGLQILAGTPPRVWAFLRNLIERSFAWVFEFVLPPKRSLWSPALPRLSDGRVSLCKLRAGERL